MSPSQLSEAWHLPQEKGILVKNTRKHRTNIKPDNCGGENIEYPDL